MSTVSFWTVLDHPRRVEVIEKLENILAEVDIEEPGLEADAFALLREVGLAVEGDDPDAVWEHEKDQDNADNAAADELRAALRRVR